MSFIKKKKAFIASAHTHKIEGHLFVLYILYTFTLIDEVESIDV